MRTLYLLVVASWQVAQSENSFKADGVVHASNGNSGANSSSSIQCACSTLAAISKGINFTGSPAYIPPYISPSDQLYVDRVDAQWSDNCYQNASCIIAPPTTSALSQTMQVVSSCKARFAVRSGGHNFNVNFSNVDNTGVLIDLANINGTKIADDKSTIDVSAGTRWEEVYAALNGTGVSVNGARNGLPGAGGSLLGGGFGYYMNKYGVSATRIKAVEVVLASGQVIEASTTNHSDLLWAIRGGGPNFGIVTKFTLSTIPVDATWYLVRLYPESSVPSILQAIANYTVLAEDDTSSNLYVNLNPTGSILGFTNTGAVTNPPIFNAFYDIPFEQELVPSTIGTEYAYAIAFATPPTPPERQYGASVAVRSDYNTFNESYMAYLPLASKATSMNGTLSLGLELVSSGAARQTSRITPMGVQIVPQTWFTTTISWPDPSTDAAMYSTADELTDTLQQIASANGNLLSFRFPNDANARQDIFEGYGSDSVQQLRSVSTRYDPDQVFQKQQNGGFLLSRFTGYQR